MLIITGTVAYDYIMNFPGKFSDHILAGKEHNINLSFIVNKFARRRGGTAGNVSYSLGLLGAKHYLFTVAGRDFEEYKKEFKLLGIETKHILIDKNNYSSTGFALTDMRDNQIWGYFYGASDNISDLRLKKVAKNGDLVLVGPAGAKGSMSIIKQCIDGKLKYMFDPGFILTQVNDGDLRLGVKNAEYIIGNDYEISIIQKRIADFNKIIKDKTIITTFGAKGSIIEKNGIKTDISAVKVDNVVDPTGAGDAWRAGFLAGYVKNFDLETCGRMGSVAAAYAVTSYGTQEHKYSKLEFAKRYKETYNTTLEL